MSFDLMPIKKDLEEISFGAFTWPVMLDETGMGYVLGCGPGRSVGQYVFVPDKNGASPRTNDGYKVSAAEARMMAVIARGYVSVKRFINKEWDALLPHERKGQEQAKYNGRPLYQPYTSEEFLKRLERFADFAEKSGGFKIH
jgi:hypothetical protein